MDGQREERKKGKCVHLCKQTRFFAAYLHGRIRGNCTCSVDGMGAEGDKKRRDENDARSFDFYVFAGEKSGRARIKRCEGTSDDARF